MYLGRVADKDDVGQGIGDDAVGGIESAWFGTLGKHYAPAMCASVACEFSNSVMMTYVCFGLNGFAFAMLLQRYEFSSV